MTPKELHKKSYKELRESLIEDWMKRKKTQERWTPIWTLRRYHDVSHNLQSVGIGGAPAGTRTQNLLIRGLMLWVNRDRLQQIRIIISVV